MGGMSSFPMSLKSLHFSYSDNGPPEVFSGFNDPWQYCHLPSHVRKGKKVSQRDFRGIKEHSSAIFLLLVVRVRV